MSGLVAQVREELIAALDDVLNDQLPDDASLAEAVDSGGVAALAERARPVDKLELAGIVLPEALGGLGGGVLDAGLVLERLGARLLDTRYSGTLTARALLARTRTVEPIGVDGTIAPVANHVRLRREAGGTRLFGTLHVAWGADDAHDLVVPADDSGVAVLVRLPVPVRHGVPAGQVDPTRELVRIELAGVPCQVEPFRAGTAAAAAGVASTLLAFGCLGSAGAVLRLAVAHAGAREQFGAPIGSFQAVQNLLVDAYVKLEDARSVAIRAARLADADRDIAETTVAPVLAARLGAAAQLHCAETAVQVLGGIGFTRDVGAHLHVKRALVNRHLAGLADVGGGFRAALSEVVREWHWNREEGN